MSIHVTCKCGRELRVKDERAGKRVKCPICHQVVKVPDEELESAGDLDWDSVPEAEPETRSATEKHEAKSKRSKSKKRKADKKGGSHKRKRSTGWGGTLQALRSVRLTGFIFASLLYGVLAILLAMGLVDVIGMVKAKLAASNIAGTAIIWFVALVALMLLGIIVWLTIQFADHYSRKIICFMLFTGIATAYVWKEETTAALNLFCLDGVSIFATALVGLVGLFRCLSVPHKSGAKPFLIAATAALLLCVAFAGATLLVGFRNVQQLSRPTEIENLIAFAAGAYVFGCLAQLAFALFTGRVAVSLNLKEVQHHMPRYLTGHACVSVAGVVVGFLLIRSILTGWPGGGTAAAFVACAGTNVVYFLRLLDDVRA